ncbi:hypothetical protein [Pseudomonas citronellolis]|uniref:hypothetical protein n=1 Tax=Pseudomonas citronellolis TaxID=53408 RepID=UPI00078EDE1E|nr:hypothetical protein [Pseudomonas citronellolis]AMO75612.1 hypothetical protein PcP3B5_21700 [Pseudomonas citronellolis]
MSKSSEKNWWEFYGIRYAQGAVTGAAIVYLLLSQNESLKRLLFLPDDPKDFGMAHLTLLAIYGLTFCYISSAPILVLHAGRGLLFKNAINPTPYKGILSRMLAMLAIPIGIPLLLMTLKVIDSVGFGAICSYACILCMQALIIINIFGSKWGKSLKYYQEIIKKRQIIDNAEYIESYRHMREHGNSFLIVIFQIFLSFPLYSICSSGWETPKQTVYILATIFFWITPAAFIWGYATRIESNLQNL